MAPLVELRSVGERLRCRSLSVGDPKRPLAWEDNGTYEDDKDVAGPRREGEEEREFGPLVKFDPTSEERNRGPAATNWAVDSVEYRAPGNPRWDGDTDRDLLDEPPCTASEDVKRPVPGFKSELDIILGDWLRLPRESGSAYDRSA
jgi:hypothetical protein